MNGITGVGGQSGSGWVAAAVGGLVLACGSLLGSVVVQMDLEGLVAGADTIVQGRAEAVYSQWDSDRRVIYTYISGSSAEFVGKTVFHRRLRRPRCSPSLKASLASSAAAPALTLGCAPRCRLVWAMGNGASGGGSGHRA